MVDMAVESKIKKRVRGEEVKFSSSPIDLDKLDRIVNGPKLFGMTRRIAVTVIALVAAALLFSAYFYIQYSGARTPLPTVQTEAADLVAEIGKLIVLPSDETPTVATVTDLEPLRDQPFFANAKIGDKVLIYSNAKKAILYDPIAKKIVEVAPINIGTPISTQAP